MSARSKSFIRSLRHLVRAGALSALLLPAVVLAGESVSEGGESPGEQPKAVVRHALLVGSSSMNDWFGHLIAADLETRGYQVERKGFAAAGFSRPDFRDMLQTIDSLPVSAQTDLVIIYLGMNDAQALWLQPHEREGAAEWIKWGEERWEAVYEQRALAYFSALCERGAKKAVVLLPVDVMRASMQRRLERIRDLQAKAASRSHCTTAVSTGGDVGKFRIDGKPTRAKDGVHMSRKGAQVIWKRVRGPVLGHTGT